MKVLQISLIVLAVALLCTLAKVVVLELKVYHLESAPPCPCAAERMERLNSDDFLFGGDEEPSGRNRVR